MKAIILFLTGIAIILTSCSPTPEPIHYGQDACSYCKMAIIDQRYGAELVTDKGKVYKFDAVECMVNYMNENSTTSFVHVLVSTFDGRKLIDAAVSHYLRSESLPSPMGMYITAVSDAQKAKEYQHQYGGKLYSWEELRMNFTSLPVITPRALKE